MFDPYDPEVQRFRDNPDKLAALLRDIRTAQANGQIEFSDTGMMIVHGNVNIEAGGVFHSSVLRHEAVQRAIDDGDPEREAWVREWVRRNGDIHTLRGYFRDQVGADHNIIPTFGRNYLLDLMLDATTSKITAWWHGPFKSAWTPAATARSNWAGATSGPLATEVADADIDESGRQAAVFTTAAASAAKGAASATRITFASGTSGITLYGSTLNESGTIGYNATDKVLLSAATFASGAKSNLGATDKVDLDFDISATST
jgi:hypothetical protein